MRVEDARWESFRAGLPDVLDEIKSREEQDMDSTRSTVEMLSHAELQEAFDAYCSGTKIGMLAARYGVYPAELQNKFDQMAAELGESPRPQRGSKRYHVLGEDSERQSARSHTIQDLHERLFRELDHIDEVDVSDVDALKAEAMRARAVEGISKTIIDNVDLMIRVTQMRATLGENMPKMLNG